MSIALSVNLLNIHHIGHPLELVLISIGSCTELDDCAFWASSMRKSIVATNLENAAIEEAHELVTVADDGVTRRVCHSQIEVFYVELANVLSLRRLAQPNPQGSGNPGGHRHGNFQLAARAFAP